MPRPTACQKPLSLGCVLTVAPLCPSKPQVSNMSLYRIKDRFAYMKAQGAVEVDVWEAPIPEDWFNYF